MKLNRPNKLLPALAASALLVLPALNASAALTVTVSAVPGEPTFTTSTGSALPDGAYFQLGTFATAPSASDVSENAPTVFAQWQEFADDTDEQIFTIELPGGHAAGDIFGPDSFAGKSIFWWVFLTSDGQKPALDFSNVTEHALFTSSSPDWLFPADSESIPPVVSTADPNISFLAGGYGSGNTTIALAAIPEPSSVLTLSALALAGCLRRRR